MHRRRLLAAKSLGFVDPWPWLRPFSHGVTIWQESRRPRRLDRQARWHWLRATGCGVFDGAAKELEARRIELVGPLAKPVRSVEALVDPESNCLARQRGSRLRSGDDVDVVFGTLGRAGHEFDPGRSGEGQRLADVFGAPIRGADEPDLACLPAAPRSRGRAPRSPGRRASPRPEPGRRPGLGLVRVNWCRHEVVVNPNTSRAVIEQGAFIRCPGNSSQALGVEPATALVHPRTARGRAGPDARSVAARRSPRPLVAVKPMRRATQHLRNEAGEGFTPRRWGGRSATFGPRHGDSRRSKRPTTADSRPDRVRVDAQRGTKLPHRGEPGAGQQPSGVDLIAEFRRSGRGRGVEPRSTRICPSG